MAKSTNKKLTSDFLKKKSKELNEKQVHLVTVDGETYSIGIDKKFLNSKINDFGIDVGSFASLLITDESFKELTEVQTQSITQKYLYTMLIKHFTDVEIPDNYTEALLTYDVLENLGLTSEIITKMDEEEVKKSLEIVNERLALASSNLKERMEKLTEEFLKAEAEDEKAELIEEFVDELEGKTKEE